MRSSTIFTAALLAAPSLQAPSSSGNLTDADILNFALTLEHLEAAFYVQGLAKYDAKAFTSAGFSDDVRKKIQTISDDETSHVDFLVSALKAAGATPVQACNYTFPHTDPKSFLAVSQILEGVGVSAYLGAAGSISNSNYLTAAATILTVEARHNAYIRLANGLSPFPGAFDTPIDPRSVVTLATPFFTGCPNGSAPSFAGFPSLNVTGKLTPGSKLTVASANTTGATNCMFLSGLNSTSSTFANGTCDVPTDGKIGAGQIYVLLTSAPNVTDVSTIAGPAIVETQVPSASGSSKSLSTNTASGSAETSDASSVSTGIFGLLSAAAVGMFALIV